MMGVDLDRDFDCCFRFQLRTYYNSLNYLRTICPIYKRWDSRAKNWRYAVEDREWPSHHVKELDWTAGFYPAVRLALRMYIICSRRIRELPK